MSEENVEKLRGIHGGVGIAKTDLEAWNSERGRPFSFDPKMAYEDPILARPCWRDLPRLRGCSPGQRNGGFEPFETLTC